jgi:hypothetical protein
VIVAMPLQGGAPITLCDHRSDQRPGRCNTIIDSRASDVIVYWRTPTLRWKLAVITLGIVLLDFLGPRNTGGDPERRSYSYVHLSDLKVDHMWRYAFLLQPKP